MKLNRISYVLAGALLLGAPAVAQETVPAAPAAPATPEVAVAAAFVTAEAV